MVTDPRKQRRGLLPLRAAVRRQCLRQGLNRRVRPITVAGWLEEVGGGESTVSDSCSRLVCAVGALVAPLRDGEVCKERGVTPRCAGQDRAGSRAVGTADQMFLAWGPWLCALSGTV